MLWPCIASLHILFGHNSCRDSVMKIPIVEWPTLMLQLKNFYRALILLPQFQIQNMFVVQINASIFMHVNHIIFSESKSLYLSLFFAYTGIWYFFIVSFIVFFLHRHLIFAHCIFHCFLPTQAFDICSLYLSLFLAYTGIWYLLIVSFIVFCLHRHSIFDYQPHLQNFLHWKRDQCNYFLQHHFWNVS